MEGQKFEIPEDPTQTLPELSPMDPTWWNYFLKLSRIPEKKQFLAAILANIGLRNSQADLGLDAAQFRVFHTLRSTKSTTASRTLNVASSLGAPTPRWCTALTLRPVTCGRRRSGFCLKHFWRLVCRKLRRKLAVVSQRAKNRILRGCDGRPRDNRSKLMWLFRNEEE